MNGILNLIAAIVIGIAIIWAGSQFVKSRQAEDPTVVATADTASSSEAEEKLEGQENSFTGSSDQQNVASTTQESAENTTANSSTSLSETTQETIKDGSSKAAEGTRSTSSETTDMMAALYNGDLSETEKNEAKAAAESNSTEAKKFQTADNTVNGKLVSKADDGRFFTENQRVNGKLVSKPDTGKFFTADQVKNGRFVDKYDDSKFFTETSDPCLREDGTVYTGPGTAKDPYAEGDPCLVKQVIVKKPYDPCLYADGTPYTGTGTVNDPYAPGDPCLVKPPVVVTENEDPCVYADGTPYTGTGTVNDPNAVGDPCLTTAPPVAPVTWTSPYQEVGPEFPRTTLGPNGSDYTVQMTSRVTDYATR